MKGKMILAAAAMALSLGLAGTPASWANSLTFQGVTFNLTDNGGGSLTFNILNAVSGGTGDWSDIEYINAFALKGTDATTMTLASWTVNNLELSNGGGGCDGGPSGGFCFTYDTTLPLAPLALTNDMTFNITYTGTLDMSAPHLKVFFMNEADQVKCTGGPNGSCVPEKSGNILSQDIPGNRVPEPASLLLLGAGLAGLGIWRRKQA